MTVQSPPTDFVPSVLGTKEYWDSMYETEIKNFQDHGDEGEIWFGEDSEEKMVDWVLDNHTNHGTRILDLGCGNGHLLFSLAESSYTNLTGIDYSPSAISLAKSILSTRNFPSSPSIQFFQADLLNSNSVEQFVTKAVLKENGKFDVILDKGTFDAICLSSASPSPPTSVDSENEKPKTTEKQKPADKKHLATLFVNSILQLLADDGHFLLTSCNWTMDELIWLFSGDEMTSDIATSDDNGSSDEPSKKAKTLGLSYHSHVRYPTFKFGGVEGQKVVTVAFKKQI
ncbi:S-adenosyl-L-methionine-dependent methyltransferase [Paraphysoderma sedebokerense]|nr:S-adenosyl-L-methionine-dependent methyltransferase [Paraphysoderma sedebokerense]